MRRFLARLRAWRWQSTEADLLRMQLATLKEERAEERAELRRLRQFAAAVVNATKDMG